MGGVAMPCAADRLSLHLREADGPVRGISPSEGGMAIGAVGYADERAGASAGGQDS